MLVVQAVSAVDYQLLNFILRLVGGAAVAIGHSTVLPAPWGQILGEIGAGLVLYSAQRIGDVPISDLPAEIQEAVRPSKSP